MLYIKAILTFLFLLNVTFTATGQSPQLDILLIDAIQVGDPEAVNDLIEKGANVQESYIPISPSTFISPLELALRLYNRPEQGLISNPADRYANNHKVIDILIKHGGAHLNGQPWTILHQLASEHNVQDMKSLKYKNADINAKDISGNTPLHEVVKLCSRCLRFPLKNSERHSFRSARVTIEFLLENDADINAKNNDGDTPLHLAIKNTVFLDQKPPFFYRTLIRHSSKTQEAGAFNKDTSSTSLPINISILDILDGSFLSSYYIHYIKFIKTLIENGADIYAKNNDGLTPIDLLAQKEHIQYYKAVTNTLLETKSDGTPNNDRACQDSLT